MSIVALTSDDGTVNGQGGDLAFVRVLGPVQVVTTSQRSLDLPSASQRRLVALLATEAPRSLRTDWICDVLAVSPSALRTTVSRVRRTVGDGAIAGSQGRYRLAVPVDAVLFTSALCQVSSRDDRIEALERALAMWTGRRRAHSVADAATVALPRSPEIPVTSRPAAGDRPADGVAIRYVSGGLPVRPRHALCPGVAARRG
jgi:hypothetical protein